MMEGCFWIDCGGSYIGCLNVSLYDEIESNVTDICNVRFDTCNSSSHSSSSFYYSSSGDNKLSTKVAVGAAAGGALGAFCLAGGGTLALMAYRRTHPIQSSQAETEGDIEWVASDLNPEFIADGETMSDNPAFEMQPLNE